MKQLDPMVFIVVFQEMLGWMFWPLILFIVLGVLAFLVVIAMDGGIRIQQLLGAELIGLLGGFIGVGLMLWSTASSPEDLLGGPIDWLLTLSIWIAGAVGATMVAYIGLSLIAGRKQGRAGG
jgi:hypothetical protein